MNTLVLTTSPAAPSLVVPRCPISVRVATAEDASFIDGLQKMHRKMVGWMPTKQLEQKIKLGHVILAEEPSPQPSPGVPGEGERVGYCIGHDQYFKRDDLGIIYQMNVVPDRQRGLIGATLIQAMFERAAYGCRLFCCWCAQDIEANFFWESLGFVPLAFRAGSRDKGRVHIFWQRRIRAGDTTTPYWFPSQTTGGSIREDRLVLPIPPGVHWREAMPRVLPSESGLLPEPKKKRSGAPAVSNSPKPLKKAIAIMSIEFGGLRFAEPKTVAAEKPKREPKRKVKNDPKHVAAARELRDRWLEQVNAKPVLSQGKYDVSRQLPGGTTPMTTRTTIIKPTPLLGAA